MNSYEMSVTIYDTTMMIVQITKETVKSEYLLLSLSHYKVLLCLEALIAYFK